MYSLVAASVSATGRFSKVILPFVMFSVCVVSPPTVTGVNCGLVALITDVSAAGSATLNSSNPKRLLM